MDRDRIEGKGREMKGKAEEAVGRLGRDSSTEVRGKIDKAVGKVQGAFGKAKDEVRAERERRREEA